MSIKKKLTMAVAVVLIIAMAIAGTYAYLTSTPAAVKNTFTFGKVVITLDEAKVKDDGTVDGNSRVAANTYKLMPGHSYTKDPTIHVESGSEACWLFVKVEDGLAAIEADTTIAAQIANNGWTALNGVDNVYYKSQAAVTADTDVAVFGSFTLKSDADVASYGNADITITAYAIQADGLETASAAWTAGGWN